MTAQILDGKACAKAQQAQLITRRIALEANGIVPKLAAILVGSNPASQVYINGKERACNRVGIQSRILRLPEDVTQAALEIEIAQLNADPTVHGILVQLPLPKHIDEAHILTQIMPEKDVDGFHPENTGRLFSGMPRFIPGTPKGIMLLLDEAGINPAGKQAVVVGRSNIVGKPIAMLLLQRNATVTICHSKTPNLSQITQQADILVVAVGKPAIVTRDMVKPGACVVDVGVNRLDTGLVGDVAADVAEVAGWLTPVPGGVGPMTITMLLENTLQAAEAL